MDVFNKKERRLIGRKSFWLVWEGLPAFGIKITLTFSHLVGMWLRKRQPRKMAVSQVRDIVYLVSVVFGSARTHPVQVI